MTRMKWYGKQVSAKVKRAAVQGLSDGAEHILEESNRIVPIDEGNLMRSGITSVDESKMHAAISYDTPYAVRLHEHPEYNFQHGREGKWLEKTLKKRKRDVQRHIADKLKRAMKG